MKDASTMISLADLANKVPDLRSLYERVSPQEISCTLASYSFGSEIDLPKDLVLGIVVSGSVEVCDEARLDRLYLAYRPIRIMGPGDFFGDFPIVDRVLGVGISTAHESWKLYAGRRSTLILQKVENLDLFCEEGLLDIQINKKTNRQPAPHVFLKASSKEEKIEIAYIHYNEATFDRSQPLFREILFAAWQKSATYRSGVNSYNLRSLFEFRHLLKHFWETASKEIDKDHIPKGRGQKKQKLKYSVSKTGPRNMQSIFADALFEALNRPMRGDALFAHNMQSLPESCWTALMDSAKVKAENVLTACHPVLGQGTYYYPIDLHNFEINIHCTAINNLSEAKDALGWQRGRHSGKAGTRDFYCRVANLTIATYLKKLQQAQNIGGIDYRYAVKCIESPYLNSQVLLLKFSAKPGLQ